jgi:PleD family two-component response regulator
MVTKIRASKEKSSAKSIHNRNEFHELIKLERERVHRNNMQFSLLIIPIHAKDSTKSGITQMVQTVSKRVRKTDQLGWYDDIHLGVLMPNTGNAGAQVVANEIRKYQGDYDCDSDIVFETLSHPNK